MATEGDSGRPDTSGEVGPGVYYLSLVLVVGPAFIGWVLIAWNCQTPVARFIIVGLVLVMVAEVAFDILRRQTGGVPTPAWEEGLRRGGQVRFTAEGGFILEGGDNEGGDNDSGALGGDGTTAGRAPQHGHGRPGRPTPNRAEIDHHRECALNSDPTDQSVGCRDSGSGGNSWPTPVATS